VLHRPREPARQIRHCERFRPDSTCYRIARPWRRDLTQELTTLFRTGGPKACCAPTNSPARLRAQKNTSSPSTNGGAQSRLPSGPTLPPLIRGAPSGWRNLSGKAYRDLEEWLDFIRSASGVQTVDGRCQTKVDSSKWITNSADLTAFSEHLEAACIPLSFQFFLRSV
jgi:hypothetical protein